SRRLGPLPVRVRCASLRVSVLALHTGSAQSTSPLLSSSTQLPQLSSEPASPPLPLPSWQLESQPSPLLRLPSSHCSPGSRTPSPHTPVAVTARLQLRSRPVLPPVWSTARSVQMPFGSSPRNFASAPSPLTLVTAVPDAGRVMSLRTVPAWS